MRHLQLTLESPAANLALDEALLLAAEAGELEGGVLRIWESPEYAVVLGRSSKASVEVRREACRRDGVPVLRRVSGGASVLVGPGCLMYAVVLEADFRLESAGIAAPVDQAHRAVLGRLESALRPYVAGVLRAGTSDLALAGAEGEPSRKFSGNSLRIKRSHLLYHGTILYNFDVTAIDRWLARPARQPDYRANRSHGQFVANLPLARPQLVAALLGAWRADAPLVDWPRRRTRRQVAAVEQVSRLID